MIEVIIKFIFVMDWLGLKFVKRCVNALCAKCAKQIK